MVSRGFEGVDQRLDQMATKDDLSRLEQKMDDGFRNVNARLDFIREDTDDLPALREELHALRRRVEQLEHKAGLAQ